MMKGVPFLLIPTRISALILYAGLLLFSCRSDRTDLDYPEKQSATSYTEYNYRGTQFYCSPLSSESLQNIHGLNARYFTDSPGLFPPRLPLVLDIQITSEANKDVTVLYEDALLAKEEGGVYSSQTRKGFYDLWAGKTAQSLRSRLSWLIDHNIHKKTIIVTPHSKSSGYFLFLLNTPRRGDFILTVPVVIDNQRGVLSLPVTLDIDPSPMAAGPLLSEPVFIPDAN
jgi:hypothetical protein